MAEACKPIARVTINHLLKKRCNEQGQLPIFRCRGHFNCPVALATSPPPSPPSPSLSISLLIRGLAEDAEPRRPPQPSSGLSRPPPTLRWPCQAFPSPSLSSFSSSLFLSHPFVTGIQNRITEPHLFASGTAQHGANRSI